MACDSNREGSGMASQLAIISNKTLLSDHDKLAIQASCTEGQLSSLTSPVQSGGKCITSFTKKDSCSEVNRNIDNCGRRFKCNGISHSFHEDLIANRTTANSMKYTNMRESVLNNNTFPYSETNASYFHSSYNFDNQTCNYDCNVQLQCKHDMFRADCKLTACRYGDVSTSYCNSLNDDNIYSGCEIAKPVRYIDNERKGNGYDNECLSNSLSNTLSCNASYSDSGQSRTKLYNHNSHGKNYDLAYTVTETRLLESTDCMYSGGKSSIKAVGQKYLNHSNSYSPFYYDYSVGRNIKISRDSSCFVMGRMYSQGMVNREYPKSGHSSYADLFTPFSENKTCLSDADRKYNLATTNGSSCKKIKYGNDESHAALDGYYCHGNGNISLETGDAVDNYPPGIAASAMDGNYHSGYSVCWGCQNYMMPTTTGK